MSHCAYCGAAATKPKYRFCSAHRYLHRSDANYGGGFSTGGDKPVESEYPAVMSAAPKREEPS